MIRKHLIPKDDFKKAMEIAKTFDFAVAIELDEGVSVSYTHLDVYKRQVQNMFVFGFAMVDG